MAKAPPPILNAIPSRVNQLVILQRHSAVSATGCLKLEYNRRSVDCYKLETIVLLDHIINVINSTFSCHQLAMQRGCLLLCNQAILLLCTVEELHISVLLGYPIVDRGSGYFCPVRLSHCYIEESPISVPLGCPFAIQRNCLFLRDQAILCFICRGAAYFCAIRQSYSYVEVPISVQLGYPIVIQRSCLFLLD